MYLKLVTLIACLLTVSSAAAQVSLGAAAPGIDASADTSMVESTAYGAAAQAQAAAGGVQAQASGAVYGVSPEAGAALSGIEAQASGALGSAQAQVDAPELPEVEADLSIGDKVSLKISAAWDGMTSFFGSLF